MRSETESPPHLTQVIWICCISRRVAKINISWLLGHTLYMPNLIKCVRCVEEGYRAISSVFEVISYISVDHMSLPHWGVLSSKHKLMIRYQVSFFMEGFYSQWVFQKHPKETEYSYWVVWTYISRTVSKFLACHWRSQLLFLELLPVFF